MFDQRGDGADRFTAAAAAVLEAVGGPCKTSLSHLRSLDTRAKTLKPHILNPSPMPKRCEKLVPQICALRKQGVQTCEQA